MPDYRCYFLADDDHIATFETAPHVGDEPAIRWAEGLLRVRSDKYAGVELWERDRLVHRKSTCAPTEGVR